MLKPICFLIGFIILLACHGTNSFAQQPERTPVIATSGQVEINEIRIARVKVSDAAPEADLTNMEISLWINVKGTSGRNFLIRLVSLESVVDDSGKELLTKARRKDIFYLKKEVDSRSTKTFRGRHGPVVLLKFDAPTRAASQIKKMKGRFEIIPTSNKKVELRDFPALVGKSIKHELLTKTKIVPRLEVNDDSTEITLEVSGQHDRLIAWAVSHDGRMLRENSQSKSAIADPIQKFGKGFRNFRPNKNTNLLLMIAKPRKKQVFEFEFNNVKLP